MDLEVITSRQCRTINRNAIWETLIAVCINRKQCYISKPTVLKALLYDLRIIWHQVRSHLNGLVRFACKVKLFLIGNYDETGRLV